MPVAYFCPWRPPKQGISGAVSERDDHVSRRKGRWFESNRGCQKKALAQMPGLLKDSSQRHQHWRGERDTEIGRNACLGISFSMETYSNEIVKAICFGGLIFYNPHIRFSFYYSVQYSQRRSRDYEKNQKAVGIGRF